MKKARVSEVPVPGAKTVQKSQSIDKPAKKQISAEFIHDSDESDVEPQRTPKKAEKSKKVEKPKKDDKLKEKAKSKEAVQIAVHRPKQNGAVVKPTKPSKPAAPATPVAAPRAAPSSAAKTREPETSSSDEESDDGEEEGVDYPEDDGKRKNGESSSETDSEDDSTSQKANKGGDESSSDNGSGSGSESEDSDEEMPDAQETTDPDLAAAPTSHTIQFRPPQPFEPPKGFRAVASRSDACPASAKVFQDLKGKQIWHITAPANVPVETIKEVSLEKVKSGQAILSHKGIDYGFLPGNADETASEKVMLPTANGYAAVPKNVSQIFHIQRVLNLPNTSAAPVPKEKYNDVPMAAAAILALSTKQPRPQPKGLRMRYFHSGFGTQEPGVLGSSEDEAEVEDVSMVDMDAPATPKSAKKAAKRGNEERAEQAGSLTKKHKKSSKDSPEAKRKHDKKERKRLKDVSKSK